MIPHLLGRARRIAERISEAVVPGPIILYYHRVTEAARDPQLLCVRPDQFERHMALIAERARGRALRDLVADQASGRLTAGDVVVTFDDGYVDNLTVAAPILRRYGIPATFFVSTGLLGTRRQFFWDELARLLLEAPRVPPVIEVSVAGQIHRFPFADQDEPTAAEWTVLQPATRDRQRAYGTLCSLLAGCSPTERESVVAAVALQVGAGRDGPDAARMMTPAEVRALDALPGLEVGAHTVGHPSLARLPDEDQRAEIAGSKSALEEILGRPVPLFAYPFGGAGDVSPTTRRLVGEVGFDAACSTAAGVVQRRSDRLHLPRILVRGLDEAAFVRHVLARAGKR